METLARYWRQGLDRWTELTTRAAWAVVLLAVLLAGAALYYTVNALGFNTDTTDMLSAELPFRRLDKAYVQAFPQYVDTLVVVIDGATPELAQAAMTALADRLARRTDLFKTVYLPVGSPFFERHGLYYLSLPELEELADNLAQVQPFLATLVREPNLAGLFSLLNEAVKAVQDGTAQLDLAALFERLDQALAAHLEGRFYQLSWQELILGRPGTAAERQRFIILQPHLDYRQLAPAAPAMEAVRGLAAELHLMPERGVRVRLTGAVALAHEELQTVSRGSELMTLVSLGLVTILLYIGLRAWQLILAALVTLLLGLVLTAGFATLAVGHLNLISIAFAVLYIGLGADYAIFYCLRYQELRQGGTDQRSVLRATAQEAGSALLICAATNVIGFYAFVPTDFVGVSELGVISGTGILICLFITLTLLPALLTLLPPVRATPVEPIIGQRFLRRLPPRLVLGVALALAVGAGLLLPRVRFDFNPIHLRDPATESVATFNDLVAQSATSPWSIVVVADNAEAARRLKTRLERLDEVAAAVTLEDFLPAQQPEKRRLLQELALVLGSTPSGTGQPAGVAEQIRALRTLLATLRALPPNSPLADRTRTAHLENFLDQLLLEQPAAQEWRLNSLEDSLLGALPASWNNLTGALAADPVTLQSLPRDLVERWVANDGRYRIQVFPKHKLDDNAALGRFVSAVQTVAPQAIDEAVIIVEAGRAVVRAFVEAFSYALAAITVLLLVLFSHKRDAPLVLTPLLFAALLTGAASVVLDIPFNFANVIALPLLLGLGVDSGIHMVHRFRQGVAARHLLSTGTVRAVFYSALTNLAGFGTLALSWHPGTASMGWLLTLGIVFMLFCTLVLLPALLQMLPAAPNPAAAGRKSPPA